MDYKSQLVTKVNNYKSYSDTVKGYVLEMLSNYPDFSDVETFKALKKQIPLILKNYAKIESFEKSLTGKVLGLERHAHAPELNELHLKSGKVISARGCTTIESAVKVIAFDRWIVWSKENQK